MRHQAFDREPDHHDLVAWFRRARARTKSLFALVIDDAYYDRPIPLRNPLVFYEGHLPAFAVNTLIKLTLQKPGIDERLETIFARGIDPADEASVRSPSDLWPARDEVLAYAAAAEELVEEHLHNCEAAFTVIEHELMHQETLVYLLHALPYEKKRLVPGSGLPFTDAVQGRAEGHTTRSTRVPAGRAILGQDPEFYGWDNEFPALAVDVGEFGIDTHNVTNADYLDYMEATGADPPHFWQKQDGAWCWRGMFALQPLSPHAPVYVTHEEASSYARWKNKRLPTEAEYHRAAAGTPPAGNFDFQSFEPVTIGQSPPSEFGVHDLIGNGWEWTSSLFAPFPGFRPMASYELYSTDFFDDAHYVLKGAAPVTPRELVRPSFRNWFRPSYPYVFATFRCAR